MSQLSVDLSDINRFKEERYSLAIQVLAVSVGGQLIPSQKNHGCGRRKQGQRTRRRGWEQDAHSSGTLQRHAPNDRLVSVGCHGLQSQHI